ncbi:hypothetical protein AB0M44_47120 [Streptosporangium subroseum]|uniref:hypothetical protein n=1 Tax=Streptosporangium subroseum TaxID=106412 RepID=UPI0034474802
MEPAARSTDAMGAELLRRLTWPLREAGWTMLTVWDDFEPEDEEHCVTLDMERAGFHITVSWTPSPGRLVVDDGSESYEWEESPLLPLPGIDETLIIDLSANASPSMQAELARRAFAAAGLLDATRLLISDQYSSLRYPIGLILLNPIYEAIKMYRGEEQAGSALEQFGEDFNWRILAGMRAWPLIVPASVPSVAARGIVEWCWRRESDVEAWHHKVGDLTMARTNIAATRAVLPHVHPEGVDWPAVRLALTAPSRRLADGRALIDLFEEGWTPILASVQREVDLWQRADDELGPQAVLRLLTLHGSRTESIGEWWGSGWYETAIRRAVAGGSLTENISAAFPDADNLADAIAYGPDLLDDETLAWAVRAVHAEQRYPWQIGQPAPAAVTLPDWAAADLITIYADPDPDLMNEVEA